MTTRPFRGLAPYGDSELDAMLFFGRERDTEIVVANLLASPLTVLYGPSGVGKTSLLRAGVARRIRELSTRGGPVGAVVVFSAWAGDPVPALAAEIAREVRRVTDAGGPPPASSSLAAVVEHWATVLDGELFLVLDQLEELFVYHEGETGPGTLVGELPEVIVRPGVRAHVLLSLRDDALAQLDVLKHSLPGLYANVVRLDRLDRPGATAAILGPVRRVNELSPGEEPVAVEPGLVDAVLAQAAIRDDPARIEPPYLQLVMERVWDEELQRRSRTLRASTLESLGGAGEIVREHLERSLGALSAREQDVAARMFEHLVTPSGTKIAHRAADLSQFAREPPAEVDPLLAALGRHRILRSLDEGAGRDARWEIFHDVLAEAILGWRRDREVERERREVRRHRRRLVMVTVASAVALVAMAAVTIFALSQRSTARAQERTAHARELAAAALTELRHDPERSLVLARQAAGLGSSTLVEDVLREALLASRVRRVVTLGGPGIAAAFRPGDTAVVGVTSTGRVVVASRSTGRILETFSVGPGRAALDPTGAHVLAYGRGRPPRLYSVSTGRAVRLPTRPVSNAVFSPSGRTLVTTDSGRIVHVWDAATGRLRRELVTPLHTRIAAVSPDDALLAVAGDARAVQTYSLRSGARVASLAEAAVPVRLAFAPSSRLLAVGGADRTAVLQSPRSGRRIAAYPGHVGRLTGIAISPQQTLVATSSTDGTARIWSVDGGLVTVLLGHGLDVTSVSFSADGSRVVTTSKDGTARVWHAESGDELAVLAGHGDAVTSAAFSRDGQSVVTAGADGTMRLWYAVAQPTLALVRDEGRFVSAARPAAGRIVVAPAGSPDVAVSPDGTLYAFAAGKQVVVRRTADDETVATVLTPAAVTGVALASDDRVAAGGGDGVARVFRFDGILLDVLRSGGAGRLTRIAFSPDGSLLAAGSTDHVARIWRLSDGHVTELRGHTDTVNSARFSADGAQLVTAGRDHDVRIWDVATGRVVRVLRAHFGDVSDAAFSPDGRWVVTAGPGKAGLFDARTGDLVFYLQGYEEPLTSASFAADDRTIVTSGVDGAIRAYRCDVCVGLPGLVRLADARLAATSRTPSPIDEAALAR